MIYSLDYRVGISVKRNTLIYKLEILFQRLVMREAQMLMGHKGKVHNNGNSGMRAWLRPRWIRDQ